jgi:hypothetical protein
MKVFLMHRDQDFDWQRELPSNEPALTQDLELNTLFNAMAIGDKFIFEVARKTVLSSLCDLDTIPYRQNVIQDCLKNSSIARDIYNLAVELIENKKKYWWGFSSGYPSSILYSSVETLKMFVIQLKKLRKIADEYAHKFDSEGFTRFFAMLHQELSDEYFISVQDHLRELKFRNGVLVSAELGTGNKGINYVLRKPKDQKQSWLDRVLARIFANKLPAYAFRIADRDQMGARALSELRGRGINLVANALAQSVDHILSFFNLLKTEMAFYVGCLNLHDQRSTKGSQPAFPCQCLPVNAENFLMDCTMSV